MFSSLVMLLDHDALGSTILAVCKTMVLCDIDAWCWLDACAHLVTQSQADDLLIAVCFADKETKWDSFLLKYAKLTSFFLLRCGAHVGKAYETHPLLCLLDEAVWNDKLAVQLEVSGRADSSLGPLVWFDNGLVISLIRRNTLMSCSCAILLWNCWSAVYRPRVHDMIATHLIPDLANLVLDALAHADLLSIAQA
jgi:hypothetical protein